MWYPPFNTGAGYAMGIRAGAEMTTFEMRFIALRCKDTIAPTGTIAQGVGAKQVNSLGEVYEDKYGLTTSQRVYGTVRENLEGRGPCYLRTEGITPEQDDSLKKAYLNMAPSQTLKWVESGRNPSEQNVEIEGTEPYIVGGHTASGYWVDTHRETTVHGLFAAGDVAGGCPQKYVTGALVEGEIAALRMVEQLDAEAGHSGTRTQDAGDEESILKDKIKEYNSILQRTNAAFTVEELEEAMQKVMDTYAGGIGTHYQFNGKQLAMAAEKIAQIETLAAGLGASDMHELMFVYELTERLVVCRSLIAHLGARKETRWHSFAENLDYPQKSDAWLRYVNSRLVDGEITMIYRDLVKEGETYEHCD
jgi:adenylylsulfate reductase subunit A